MNDLDYEVGTLEEKNEKLNKALGQTAEALVRFIKEEKRLKDLLDKSLSAFNLKPMFGFTHNGNRMYSYDLAKEIENVLKGVDNETKV